MTMACMVDYLETRGFKAERKYDPKIKKYKFTIEREGERLTSWFEYPYWGNNIMRNQIQREFLDGMIKQFEKEFNVESLYPKMLMSMIEKSNMMTIDDMRDFLVGNGCSVSVIRLPKQEGSRFDVYRNGRYVHRILNEYNIGSLTEIQRRRRWFLAEILEAFDHEERREQKRTTWTDPKTGEEFGYSWGFDKITGDFSDYVKNDIQSTSYVSNVINKIIHEKEQEEMKGIQWKVANVDITNRGYDAPDVEVTLRAYFNGPVGHIDSIKLTDILQGTLNAQWSKQNPNIIPSTKLPQIEKVIFNDPATIVIWKDGTKTVVKAHNEAYDPEKGLAMAITKKALGNEGNYFETVKKWVGDVKVDPDHSAKWLATQRLYNALGDKKATKADLKRAMEEAIKYLEAGNEN